MKLDISEDDEIIIIGKYRLEQSPSDRGNVLIFIIGDGEGGEFAVETIEKLLDDAWSEIF